VKKFNLAREVHYIQRRAAKRDGRFVTVGEGKKGTGQFPVFARNKD
jgi:hypothetical protein